MRYVYRSTPRREVGPGVYTSTEYPASEHIPLHNENAYAAQWPRLVLFHCVRAAETGGETPLADSAAVHEAIHPGVRETFVSRGLSYIRNFGTDLDLDWREAFQTQEKEVVEAYCKDAGITCEWLSPRHLRTRQVCPAVRAHPVTGKLLWFNQAHLFHHSSLAPEIAHELLSLFGEDGLPRTVRYGDGSLIEAEALAEVARAYASEERAFSWEDGDVLLLDNMRCAHGRRPFAGNRRVLAGLVAATVQGN
jgi:alpha-ketoglutarate-dependent taurine dioxygenase